MEGVGEYLTERIEAGDFPSASWLVAEGGRIVASGASGWAVLIPTRVAAGQETLYDLASLTKPLVTAPLVLRLAREARATLSDRAARFLPELARIDKSEITLAHLLTHTAGLPDWAPLYLRGESIPEYLRQIGEMDLLDRPGSRVRYSDLGYILLGAVAERIGSAGLDALASEFLTRRAGSEALFRPGPDSLGRVAATEEACNYERVKAGPLAAGYRRWREGIVRGEVHDNNAWAAGGVAGHAGLFGTAMDVYLLARATLDPDSGILAEADVRRLRRTQTGPLPEPRTAGYRVNGGPGGGQDPTTAAGEWLPPEAIGHNGFTGTSVWIDPSAGRIYVLLTNRVHPSVRESLDMNAIRREFHRRAAAA